MKKKQYSQKEKIQYWSMKVATAKHILERFERNLERVMSEDYQDFDSALAKQLRKELKKA